MYFYYRPSLREYIDQVNDPDTLFHREVAVQGLVALLRPHPFGIGENTENMLIRIEDEGAALEMTYDQNRISYKPEVGKRVWATVDFIDYEGHGYVFRAIKIKPAH